MPTTRLDTADAIELTELLQFVKEWLTLLDNEAQNAITFARLSRSPGHCSSHCTDNRTPQLPALAATTAKPPARHDPRQLKAIRFHQRLLRRNPKPVPWQGASARLAQYEPGIISFRIYRLDTLRRAA